MKILLTGGVTGGHFYPLIAVVERIEDIVAERKFLPPTIYFAAPDPYDAALLSEHDIIFKRIAAGKIRRYFSLRNFFDVFKTGWGIVTSVFHIFFLYPDVIFSKGGYSSFPPLLAARLFGIPVVIHESDAVPGRANLWAGKFARRIAVSYKDAARFFPEGKVAVTGNPVRKNIKTPAREGGHEFLKLDRTVPTVFFMGGSQGAQAINDAVLGALPELIPHVQIIHQTGKANFDDVSKTSRVILEKNSLGDRYKAFPYLNDVALRMAAGAANLIVSRAGSTIFEIAEWGVPSIMIPLPLSVGRDQMENAYAYARAGGSIVIEQQNLTPHVLTAEILRVLGDKPLMEKMRLGAREFTHGDAARTIAEEIIQIALSHEE